ncbi:MAG TPA: AAA family ATPase [Candidatus Binatia bacterium]|nr:AAA family ATPase [Candidatus Binatia bacterium]
MYAHFYQLSENPFNLTPDPKFHYVNESTREAMASLLHGIKSRKGFITLIAEAGTGKTTLLKRIVDEVEGETQIVFVFNPGVSFDELLEFICSELGIETRGCKRLHLLERLNQHLLEQLTAGRNVVVMIDEAQTLEDSVLEELRMLSNLETSKEKILQILLSGQPELDEKLRKPSLRQLRQRIGVRATLKPVQLNEMQAYVETRLRSAGAERTDLFTPASLKKIWQASGGIPRVINVICDNAMMIAFAEGQKRITPKTLNEAVRDLEGDFGSFEAGSRIREWLMSRSAGYALAAAAVVLAAIPFAGVVLRGIEAAPDTISAPAQRAESATQRIDERASGSGEAPAQDSAEARVRSPNLAPDVPAVSDAGAGEFSESEELATRQALASDPTQRPVIADSIRRAEVIARSTAARLYGARNSDGNRTNTDLADAALAEVARDRALTGFDEPAEIAVPTTPPESDVAPASEVRAAAVEPIPPIPEPARTVTIDAAAPTRDASAAQVKSIDAAPVEAPTGPALVPAPSAMIETKKPEPKKPEANTGGGAPATPAATAMSKGAGKVDVKPAAGAEASSTTAAASSPAAVTSRPPSMLGRSVAVEDGDTVWDIAIRYYGGAGPATLKRILASNPGIRDPLKLEVGSTVFLPFSRPDQMIGREGSGYRVLLAAAPTRQGLAGLEGWARGIGREIRIGKSTVGLGRTTYELYVAGLPDESAALDLATNLLERLTALVNPPQRTAMR